MRHAVIMAGGSGLRLWPLSRRTRPKHLLHLIEGKSLLRMSFERLASFLDPTFISVITNADHLPLVAGDLAELPANNLFGEPCVRDTANAVGMAAALLARRDPEGTMGIFTADHVIRPLEKFREAVETAYRVAEKNADALVTFGIKPTFPHTGLGYIHRGRPLEPGVHEVRQFKEKPPLPTATQYVESGEFYWNSGMFIWQTQTILNELKTHLPDSHEKLLQIAADWGSDEPTDLTARLYPTLEKISIDFGVMEKAARVIVVEMNCDWLDVGSWPALQEIFEPDADGNTLAATNTISLGARGNIFVSDSDHLVAAIGVEDLVVVHTDDATLICRKDDAQRMKELLDLVEAKHADRYS